MYARITCWYSRIILTKPFPHCLMTCNILYSSYAYIFIRKRRIGCMFKQNCNICTIATVYRWAFENVYPSHFCIFIVFFLLVWILFFSSVFIWYCPSVDDKDDTMNAAIYHLKDTYITSMSSNLKLLLEFVLGKRSYALAFTLYFWNNIISILFLLLSLENQMIRIYLFTILMVKQHI